MSGYEVARRLRERNTRRREDHRRHRLGQDADRSRSREAGFDLHLVKPVDELELERVLANGVHGDATLH